MRKAILIVSVTMAALVETACGGGNRSTAAPEQTPAPRESNGFPSSITLLTQGEGFSPPELEVAIGGSIEFTNEDDEKHSLTTDDKTIDVVARPGSAVTIDLADVEPGYYDFHCRFYPHYMLGSLQIGAP